jgi:hypothetical protein
MVIFYCDLSAQTLPPADCPNFLKLERKRSAAELSQQDLNEIVDIWNPEVALRNMKERFSKEASLWLIKSEGNLAGFGWTLRGATMEPYFLPLGKDDPYIFDGFILPQYRGRGLMPFWLNHALHDLGAERSGRAFTEIAEWNHAILSSLRKTPFCRLGMARKWTVFGRTIVCWAGNDAARQTRERPGKRRFAGAADRDTSDVLRRVP